MASRQPSPQIDAHRVDNDSVEVGRFEAASSADERRTVAELARWLAVLVRAGHQLREQTARLDAVRDVRWSMYAPLTTLVESGPQRVTDLAESLHLTPSSVSRTVAHLISEGLVERTADAVDGRACRLVVTARGRGVLERMVQVRNDAIGRALAEWPAADRDQLASLLRRLTLDLGLAPAGPYLPSDLPTDLGRP